ncbi:MAG: hypothetical protein O2890_16195 [Cyanobacteria bacterium]|nr:hypothetical protein [Cyanobacteriota bacterium]MDA0867905.1 hypothetical protein [Cyanobacteriota bacterium]
MDGWVSPQLQIRFVLGETELELYRPDGGKFLTTLELEQRAKAAEQRAESAEALLAKYRDRFGDLE